MSETFFADPDSMSTAFVMIGSVRDTSFKVPKDEAADYFTEMEGALGFAQMRHAFSTYMDEVQDLYGRAFVCLDDLYRASLAAALLYEKVDTEVARSALESP